MTKVPLLSRVKLILLIIVILSISLLFAKNLINKSNYEYYSSWTKAICTEKNYCEDYEIICNDKEVIKMTPTGAAVQFSKDWEDPRDKEFREKTC